MERSMKQWRLVLSRYIEMTTLTFVFLSVKLVKLISVPRLSFGFSVDRKKTNFLTKTKFFVEQRSHTLRFTGK